MLNLEYLLSTTGATFVIGNTDGSFTLNFTTGITRLATESEILTAYKEERKDFIDNQRAIYRYSDVVALGRPWQGDKVSQDLLDDVISVYVVGLPLPSKWRDKNNNDLIITDISQLRAIAEQYSLNTQWCWQNSWTKKAEIDAALTIEAINAISW